MPFKPDTAKIKRWREERQWSQEHVAELAGVGLRTIQQLESGGQASQETLKALAAAYDVDVSALALDPEEQAAELVQTRNGKTRAALRLSLWIHLASYAIGAVVFLGISWGLGYFAMKWPLIWWTVGAVAHAATVVIVEVATRYSEQWQRD